MTVLPSPLAVYAKGEPSGNSPPSSTFSHSISSACLQSCRFQAFVMRPTLNADRAKSWTIFGLRSLAFSARHLSSTGYCAQRNSVRRLSKIKLRHLLEYCQFGFFLSRSLGPLTKFLFDLS